MKVALIGTRGVPARYGGFETAAEEIGAGLAGLGHHVTVYCRDSADTASTHRGMHRVTLPALRRRSLETLSHGALSAAHALRHRPDVALVFNAANAPWVGLLKAAGIPVALHIDGHDGRRAKWNGAGRRYYSLATRWGSRVATRTIVDSQAIKTEMDQLHSIDTTYIPYGATATTFTQGTLATVLAPQGLHPGQYHLIVARFEPENQVQELIDSYVRSTARLPLVVVGFAGYPGPYAEAIRVTAAADERVRLVGPVWDQHLLDALYAGAASYLHGHSVGGTNPSLLRAMAHGTPVIGYDCVYNRETTGGDALWFASPAQVGSVVGHAESSPTALSEIAHQLRQRAAQSYRWDDVVRQYDELLARLTDTAAKREIPSSPTHAAL